MKKIISFFRNIIDFCRHSDSFVHVIESDYNRIHEMHKNDPVV